MRGETQRKGEGGRCPSCGRFVGLYDRCPYCGATLHRRITVHTIKLAVLTLTLLGLIGLWWMARHAETPLITAADAGGTLNLSYVRLRGTVVRQLKYDPESGYLAFWLDDGTGELYVAAYRDVAAVLVASDQVPAPGDEIEVAGTLRVREDFLSLTINAPEQVELQRQSPIALKTGQLTRLDEGNRVVIQGKVVDLRTPYEGLTLITLDDGSGGVTVSVDETAIALGGPLPTLTVGMGAVVTGSVTLYHDQPQVSPLTTDDLCPLPTPPASVEVALQPIAEVTAEHGQARVQGRIITLEGFKGGLRGTLADESGEIILLLWESLYEALPEPSAVDVGARVEVEGEVKRYEGVLELVPRHSEAVRLIEAAPPLPLTTVAELSAADEGRLVRLLGLLGKPSSFSAGVKMPLDDGSGTITVLLWSNIAEKIEPPPEEGMGVEVVGIIQLYRDEMEIVPRSSLDWRPSDR